MVSTSDITAVFSAIVYLTSDTATTTLATSTIDAPIATPATSKAPISDITMVSISSTMTLSMFTYT